MAAKKDLHTLIRLRQWDVDEKRRLMAVALRGEEHLMDQQRLLAEEIAQEKAFVSKAPPEQRTTFVAYLELCAQKRDKLAAALADLRKQIEVMRDELAESYRRLKTFEVTQDLRDVETAKEEARVEQIDLDEMGLNVHRQKTKAAAI